MDADKIIVMDQGQIVESGKHNELMDEGGLYAKLYAMNFQDLPLEENVETTN